MITVPFPIYYPIMLT